MTTDGDGGHKPSLPEAQLFPRPSWSSSAQHPAKKAPETCGYPYGFLRPLEQVTCFKVSAGGKRQAWAGIGVDFKSLEQREPSPGLRSHAPLRGQCTLRRRGLAGMPGSMLDCTFKALGSTGSQVLPRGESGLFSVLPFQCGEKGHYANKCGKSRLGMLLGK